MACLPTISPGWRKFLRFVGAASVLAACSSNNYTTGHHNDEGGIIDDDPGDPNLTPPRPPDYENDDSGSFDLGGHKSDGGHPLNDGGRPVEDGGQPPPVDAGPPVDSGTGPKLCGPSLVLGDVKIVEIMISSVSGSGDKGEWVEIQSTHGTCSVNVKGLSISSPRGDAGVDTVTITNDLILPPNGMFVVADSTDPTINGHLPAAVFSWNTSDVLKNSGDTIDVKLGTTLIDTLTYPAFTNLSTNVGRSVSFPSDCAWSDRSTWDNWSYSFSYYSGLFQGTPNTDNDDVSCPF